MRLGSLSGTPAPVTPTLESEETPGTASTPQPETPSETETPPQLPEVITLHLWLPPEFDPNDGTLAGNLLKARLEEFTAQNPGVSIEVRLKAVQGAGGLLRIAGHRQRGGAAGAARPGGAAAPAARISRPEGVDLSLRRGDNFTGGRRLV